MSNWLSFFKNTFYLIGSAAGVLAFVRPVIESKHQKDIARVTELLSKFPEGQVMEIEYFVYSSRRIPESVLSPFDEIEYKYNKGWKEMRFQGPLRKQIESELKQLTKEYRHFRDFIQVPEWEPQQVNNQDSWIFNKEAFREGRIIKDDYVKHLEQATDASIQLRTRFQRIQALSDLHFFEALFGFFFVPRLFKKAQLQCSTK